MTKKLTGSLLWYLINTSPNHWAEVVPAAMFVLVVQEPERSHQGASGRATETPLLEGRGGVWRVLQRASPSSRGCLHWPANKGFTKRYKIGPEHTFSITELAEVKSTHFRFRREHLFVIEHLNCSFVIEQWWQQLRHITVVKCFWFVPLKEFNYFLEMEDSQWTCNVEIYPERCVLNDRGKPN